MHDDLQDKNSHSLYLSNEAMQIAQELKTVLGVSSRSLVFEIAIRALHQARSAHAYKIAYQQARTDIEKELGISPSTYTE